MIFYINYITRKTLKFRGTSETPSWHFFLIGRHVFISIDRRRCRASSRIQKVARKSRNVYLLHASRFFFFPAFGRADANDKLQMHLSGSSRKTKSSSQTWRRSNLRRYCDSPSQCDRQKVLPITFKAECFFPLPPFPPF